MLIVIVRYWILYITLTSCWAILRTGLNGKVHFETILITITNWNIDSWYRRFGKHFFRVGTFVYWHSIFFFSPYAIDYSIHLALCPMMSAASITTHCGSYWTKLKSIFQSDNISLCMILGNLTATTVANPHAVSNSTRKRWFRFVKRSRFHYNAVIKKHITKTISLFYSRLIFPLKHSATQI